MASKISWSLKTDLRFLEIDLWSVTYTSQNNQDDCLADDTLNLGYQGLERSKYLLGY